MSRLPRSATPERSHPPPSSDAQRAPPRAALDGTSMRHAHPGSAPLQAAQAAGGAAEGEQRGGRASPLSVSSRSVPSPPASPRGDLTPIAAPEASQGQCCVCLEALRPPGCGANAAAPFPTCARHRMHVGCLAQFRVQASGPSELLCLLCRHSRCPDCIPGGWTARHDAEVRAACEREGVPMPSRLTGEDTVRGAVRDYTLRTSTTNDAPEPPPPPGGECPLLSSCRGRQRGEWS